MNRRSVPVKRPRNFYLYTFGSVALLNLVFGNAYKSLTDCEDYLFGFITIEIIIRFFMLLEYIKTTKIHYSQLKNIFNEIFHLNNITKTVVIVIFARKMLGISAAQFMDKIPMLCVYLFIKIIGLDENPYRRSVWLENCNGLDYGSGMAYSFFHGYLNIILPNRGDKNESLESLMKQYEANHKIKFGLHKLIILVPKDLYCPPDISDLAKKGNIKMEACNTLLSIERNRAGVQNRVYKNPVYKVIKNDGTDPVYFVVEGATPLLTLYESLKTTSDHQKSYEENKDLIVLQFYRTIKKLVAESIECKDICDIVYYNDNEVENIGELLLQMVSD